MEDIGQHMSPFPNFIYDEAVKCIFSNDSSKIFIPMISLYRQEITYSYIYQQPTLTLINILFLYNEVISCKSHTLNLS